MLGQAMMKVKDICVFCGASAGSDPAYAKAASALGQAMAIRGLGLVYGGGNIGLMGLLADAVLAEGGRAVGVIPQKLVDRELAHQGLAKLHVVSPSRSMWYPRAGPRAYPPYRHGIPPTGNLCSKHNFGMYLSLKT